MKKKVKISDIANQSGVSLSTVSLVLNNKPGVSQETRSRVLDAAGELGYPIKPVTAQGTNHLTTIGMAVKIDPDMPPQGNPFYSKVMLGIEDVCRRKGINLLFATLPVDENNRPLEAPALLHNDLVDGLLLVGTFIDESFSLMSKKNSTPIVLVDGYSEADRYDEVVSDNFRAAYQAVEFLIGKGHRYIGLIGSEENCYPSLKDRRNGYLRALKENGISEAYIANFNINRSHGYQETITLLKEKPQITALFCVNDDVGNAAIKAVQDLDKLVPEDVSVVSFDDTFVATAACPPLTTVHIDTVAMGRAAVHLLSLRLDNPDSSRMTLTIHPWLVERESVGPARSHFSD
jgi:DNA-binding LacI/PurR family transcriptional regulator